MDVVVVKKILVDELNFTNENIEKLSIFHNELINYNKEYNLISKNTENDVWERHILDSAQTCSNLHNLSGITNMYPLTSSTKSVPQLILVKLILFLNFII